MNTTQGKEQRFENTGMPKCYRVWFKDGSAVLLDAFSARDAIALTEKRIAKGELYGKVKHAECLDS